MVQVGLSLVYFFDVFGVLWTGAHCVGEMPKVRLQCVILCKRF